MLVLKAHNNTFIDFLPSLQQFREPVPEEGRVDGPGTSMSDLTDPEALDSDSFHANDAEFSDASTVVGEIDVSHIDSLLKSWKEANGPGQGGNVLSEADAASARAAQHTDADSTDDEVTFRQVPPEESDEDQGDMDDQDETSSTSTGFGRQDPDDERDGDYIDCVVSRCVLPE